ncbi:MAG: hypothetical protein EAZ16_13820 [Sphingobacteriales bacterium]|nr:MAG: hypothetical protein EAZ16_13820 [Sphingobacteriales bacterium]
MIRDLLLAEHSKAQCNRIVKYVGTNQQRFDELFQLFLSDEYRVVQRAAWPVSYAVIAHPALIQKHFTRLIKNLEKPGIHTAVKRNSIRLLQEIPVPKRYHGKLMDICFSYIATPAEAIAVKAFSLTVLQNLSDQYPEIIPEIKLLIEENYDRETPAFKSRAKQFLQKIAKKKKL